MQLFLNTSKIAKIILTKLSIKMPPLTKKWLNMLRINTLLAKKHPLDDNKVLIEITFIFLCVASNKEA